MQLLDRYLTAIKFWLPKAQRDDIISELAANLQAEIDDRVSELGRPLTNDEVAILLNQHGSPILVASRYRFESRTVTFGRQIIGPILFPFYWVALKITLVLLILQAILPVVLFHTDGPVFADLGHAVVRFFRFSLPVLLLVTVAFALLDYALRKFRLIEKWSGDWDSRKLPSSERQEKQVRRSSSVAGIILQSIIVIWWWNHGNVPAVVITNAGAQVHLAPVFGTLYVPILIIFVINLVQHCVNLIEPNWRWLPSLTGFVTSVAALVILYPLLYTSPLISIFDRNGVPISMSEAAEIQKVLWVAMVSLWIGIAVAAAIFAWSLARLPWKTIPPPVASARSNGMVSL
jgi:hypothetical protein